MRNASIAVLREIGVETGGSNVQFAVNPKNGKMVVIEMNPRVSRSSALASKLQDFQLQKLPQDWQLDTPLMKYLMKLLQLHLPPSNLA